ncbi:MAG: Holliday junction resolvase RuvX [Calothrix sp. C42_A2020_038]|nr:Holliday junction resolvase RuvX [Calothrix sp. C42_A2020_038]
MPTRSSCVGSQDTDKKELGTVDRRLEEIIPTSLGTVSDEQFRSESKYVSALGLDVGRKRIGVAGCDKTGLIATGITTIERARFEEDIEQLRQLIQMREVNVLVVGLPYNMDGTLGFQARQVQKFANRVSKILKLPLEYVDERLTSFQAEQMLLAENLSPSRNKGLIDRKAAALILQQWLDARRNKQTRLTPNA